jgi:hypothetical protein
LIANSQQIIEWECKNEEFKRRLAYLSPELEALRYKVKAKMDKEEACISGNESLYLNMEQHENIFYTPISKKDFIENELVTNKHCATVIVNELLPDHIIVCVGADNFTWYNFETEQLITVPRPKTLPWNK